MFGREIQTWKKNLCKPDCEIPPINTTTKIDFMG